MSLAPILIAKGEKEVHLIPGMVNRHGLVAGATGTGKTVTLRVLAERFSSIGVPVFMADVKGDLSGLSAPGGDHPKVAERVKSLGLKDFKPEGFPVVFWDLYAERGHPVRTTISEMGPLLLGRLLGLNETQGGVLNLIFRVADEGGMLLLDLKDLKSMAKHVGDNAAELKTAYGNISPASIGAIQRNLLALEDQGADRFFGEPALDLRDFMQTDPSGRGTINILSAEKLILSPKLYATFLLWLLSELFEELPEAGDPERPKLVLFFDEAHLLFEDMPKILEDKIEQVVRLIRSKGVGVYFVTQSPLDIPEAVLGQLGNRVQHALRAFTPKDQKAVKVAADTFRQNPALDTYRTILELGVGEALVSTLDEKGTPSMVERAMICPPESRLSPLGPGELEAAVRGSVVYGHYEKAVDRVSAYEQLRDKALRAGAEGQGEAQVPEKAPEKAREPRSQVSGVFGAAVKSAARSVGSQIGRQIVRGILGSLFGGSSGRRSRR